MAENTMTYKYADLSRPFVIDQTEVKPGEYALIRMKAGRLPSDTRIHVTAHVYRGVSPGPTMLLLAGVHGDEINGIETLRGLVDSNIFSSIESGNVIVIPLLNVFGFINFSRDVPDGKDVNRSFPGNLNGSLASRVARIISKKILPHLDLAIDFHTGGASRYNYPQIRYSPKDTIAFELGKKFSAPYLVTKPTISRSFRKICKDQGIPAIVYEGGESIRLDGLAIETAQKGILRVLNALEMGPFQQSEPKLSKLHILKTSWIRAPYSGIFIWSRPSGSFVEKNEVIGLIKDPYGLKTVQVLSNKKGYIIGHNNASVVNHGDALYNLAYEYEELENEN